MYPDFLIKKLQARWNAVYAVGCVFENTAIMSEMDSSILVRMLLVFGNAFNSLVPK